MQNVTPEWQKVRASAKTALSIQFPLLHLPLAVKAHPPLNPHLTLRPLIPCTSRTASLSALHPIRLPLHPPSPASFNASPHKPPSPGVCAAA